MSRSTLNRRSFLKAAATLAPAIALPNLVSWLDARHNHLQTSPPTIIVILFDAMSARNLSVYGYPRATAPNLERFAERATVYHSHMSGGNYTIPGTASLLTGTYPWTHRAINYSGQVKSSLVGSNIFKAFGDDYHRLAWGQNVWSQFILTQFADDIDTLLEPGTFGRLSYLIGTHFKNDQNMAIRALDDFIFKNELEPASLLFGTLERTLYFRDSNKIASDGYARGIPRNVNYPVFFRLEDLFAGMASLLKNLASPTFAYLHLFPPHAPYRSSEKFFGKFVDGWSPVRKPVHRFSDQLSNQILKTARRSYDEYVATLDDQFGRLFDFMEASGVLENSYVIVTSDHGEMFERGEKAHATPLLYDPIVHVPLLISAPGQKTRRDITSPTSAVDVLPTLLQLAGKPAPSWSEGKLLPGFGGVEDMERSMFVMDAKNSIAFRPFKKASISMRKGNYKLIYYTGYESDDSFELYDLDADLEELTDLYPQQPAIAKRMKEELLESFLDANKAYTG